MGEESAAQGGRQRKFTRIVIVYVATYVHK